MKSLPLPTPALNMLNTRFRRQLLETLPDDLRNLYEQVGYEVNVFPVLTRKYEGATVWLITSDGDGVDIVRTTITNSFLRAVAEGSKTLHGNVYHSSVVAILTETFEPIWRRSCEAQPKKAKPKIPGVSNFFADEDEDESDD